MHTHFVVAVASIMRQASDPGLGLIIFQHKNFDFKIRSSLFDRHQQPEYHELSISDFHNKLVWGGQVSVSWKIAFCSQSQFGNQAEGSGKRLRAAIEILDSAPRDFAYEGEMNIDTALDTELRERLLPDNRMSGAANVLIFAHADAASGVRNILKMKAGGLEVGPILMGMGNRAHIVTPSITARGLLNMAAIAGTPVAHYG